MDVGTRTKTLNWACGLSAVAAFLLAFPAVLVCAYLAWWAYHLQSWLAFAFWISFAVALLALPARFVRAYDRWQTRVGIQ